MAPGRPSRTYFGATVISLTADRSFSCIFLMSPLKMYEMASRSRAQGTHMAAEMLKAAPIPRATERTPPTNLPSPVPTESVRLKIEKMDPRFSGDVHIQQHCLHVRVGDHGDERGKKAKDQHERQVSSQGQNENDHRYQGPGEGRSRAQERKMGSRALEQGASPQPADNCSDGCPDAEEQEHRGRFLDGKAPGLARNFTRKSGIAPQGIVPTSPWMNRYRLVFTRNNSR